MYIYKDRILSIWVLAYQSSNSLFGRKFVVLTVENKINILAFICNLSTLQNYKKMLQLQRQLFINISPNIIKPRAYPARYFWEYVNMMFNKPDPERIKTLGPDRACAEWVLRNGGKVIWSDGKKLKDYNLLPPETQSVPKIVTIDGTESSISHYGFSHLCGCTMLQNIILHDNKYIDDRAMKGLENGKDTLIHVQVSKCDNVTDAGIKELKSLTKLKTLVLFNLSGVNNLDECIQELTSQIKNCKISGEKEKLNG